LTWRTPQEAAFRSRAAETRVLFSILEEIHNLDQFPFGLIDTGDVVKGHPCLRFLVIAARPASTDSHEATHSAALLPCPPEHPNIEADQKQRRGESEKECGQGAALLLNGVSADLHLVFDEEC